MRKARDYTIAEMAEQFGLTLRSLRFYEERGLLSPVRHGSVRLYNEDERLKLADIVRWRSQGFTIAEIKEAMLDGGFPTKKIIAQIEHLRQQRAEIDTAIVELMQAEQCPAAS
ncbi:hypothetical protein IP69_11740 [Bosea sp. AAP35]|uniref:MerR family transcriptional regulator n=1 Tax=Bosea sp. AAP35 TaxID=1523417 RepID=UPI0006B8B861|nr:MerR family transcriptional regulator [Bosea sp. AAP35]KPF68330.1 hypothetical protein IP69_11740 [Bosea sp. AAP35]